MAYLHQELKHKSVTLQLLWEEYIKNHPEGYRYTQFCGYYKRWKKTLDLSLRQEHRAGEKMFVDWAGQTIPIIDPDTGQIKQAYLFVAVLGASNYTYAEATLTQQLADWIAVHTRAYEYFGGVAKITVPDNTKTAIGRVCRYEPQLQSTYGDMGKHYRTAIIPTRVAKPRDKAKVEVGVQIAERWILAALRHRKFFSLAELNQAVRELLEKMNKRPFKKIPGSRIELFQKIEYPALLPLPQEPYVLALWKKAKVNIDYHIQVDRHMYSVPYQLVGQEVEVRLTDKIVEIFYKGNRVAGHQRSHQPAGYTTIAAHRPKTHQKYLQWTPSRLVRWASSTGPYCQKVVERILETKPHIEQGYRACLGIMRLGKLHSLADLEAACKRALVLEACSYRSIESILKTKLYTQSVEGNQMELAPTGFEHENIRGKTYYL